MSAETNELEQYGYQQELKRTLSFFSNFGVAFTYLSPVVGIYSLFALGIGTGGPAYIWSMPLVIIGQILVALTFSEMASSFPLAGALFQWSKNLVGRKYGWWVGWIYAWALIITVASVDTGVSSYLATLINNVFGTHINGSNNNVILLITVIFIVLQSLLNIVGVKVTGLIARAGIYVEVLGTIGVAVLLAFLGFHHGVGFLTHSENVQNVRSNPYGVNFGGKWFPGAFLIAALASVYLFYGFESAGDVAEEVKDAKRQVPKAMLTTMVVGGIVSFLLVAALTLSIPGHNLSKVIAGGVPYILSAQTSSVGLQDILLLVIVLAFFGCGTAVQAAGSRVLFSYARDNAMPFSASLRNVSKRWQTPVVAVAVAGILPVLFALLARINPSKPIHILFITYPANVNALFILVSFATSGIYLSFQLVVIGGLWARLRGWRPAGFNLGRWAIPVYVLAIIYGLGMLVNIMYPSGLTSPRGVLFNYDWMTIAVVVLLLALGGIYVLLHKPHSRIPEPLPWKEDRK
ncbi:MAG: APC family permease [Acidimicrobiales bacterium]